MKRVLIPFLCWSVLLFCFSVFKEHWEIKWTLVWDFCQLTATTGVKGIYWYVYLIIGLYLITPVIHPFFSQADRQALNYVAGISIAFVIISAVWPDVKWVKSFHSEYFKYVAYFGLGYIMVTHWRKEKWFKITMPIVAVLSLALCVICPSAFPANYFFNIALFGCLLLVGVPSPGVATTAMVFVSKTSYGIYLSHILFISAFVQLGLHVKIPLPLEPLAMGILVLVADVLMQWGIKAVRLNKWLC